MERRKFLATSLATSGLALAALEGRAAAQGAGFGGLIDLRAFGARGDGVTDDTSAFLSALAAVPRGGALFVDFGVFRLTSAISIPRSMMIFGAGWISPQYQTQLGAPGWSRVSGSVLYFSNPASAGFSYQLSPGGPSSPNESALNLRHVAIRGPGSGTNTGILIGGNPSLFWGMTSACWIDVLVGNFDTGVSFGGCQQNTFLGLRVRGCNTGIIWTDSDNTTNWFYGGEVQNTNVYGWNENGNGSKNNLLGMLFQNAGATAIRLQGSGYTIADCWFENASNTGNDILVLGGSHRIIRNIGFRKSIVLYNSGCIGVLIDQNLFQQDPPNGVTINNYIPPIRGNYIGPNNQNCIITDNSGDLNDLGGGAFQTYNLDADLTVTPLGLGTEITVNITSLLTADRNCTLATTNAVVGRTRVRVLNNSLGGHNVNVRVGNTLLRTLPPGTVGYFMCAPGSTYVVAE
jgi:hypothetical protein